MSGRLFDLPTKKRNIGELLATFLSLSLSLSLSHLQPVFVHCSVEHLISSDNIHQVCELIHQHTVGKKCHCEDSYSIIKLFFVFLIKVTIKIYVCVCKLK